MKSYSKVLLSLMMCLSVTCYANPQLAPNGQYVGGTPQLAPNGQYVCGTPQLAPNGQYVGTGC